MYIKNRNIKATRIIFGVMSIACMILIFMFSADNGEESSNKSGLLVSIVEYFMGGNVNPETTENITFIIRKLAHFSIYALLGFLVSGTLSIIRLISKKTLLSLTICFIYACSDEIHQRFVPERNGNIKDVLIDTCGSLCGIIVFITFCYILLKLRKRKGE